MLPGALRGATLEVAVDPRLAEVMPRLWQDLQRAPWRVHPFGPGGGEAPSSVSPRLLVDMGGTQAATFVREFRTSNGLAPLLVVSPTRVLTEKRADTLLRSGVDEFYEASGPEEIALQGRLSRVCLALAVCGGVLQSMGTYEWGDPKDDYARALTAVLTRDSCPRWRLADVYRRCRIAERKAERHTAKGPYRRWALLHRRCLVARAWQLRARGQTWGEVGHLLDAPSAQAVRERAQRYASLGRLP